ncbi:DNA primase, partial [Candidatus Riflebacteria bacterium]
MDANEFALKVKPAAKSLGLMLQSAEYIGKKNIIKLPEPAAKKEEFSTKEKIENKIQQTHVEVSDREVTITISDRIYRIRGLAKTGSFDSMKLNIRLSCNENFYMDTIDLYQAKHRKGFIQAASEELNIKAELIKSDLAELVLKLEAVQENLTSQQEKEENESESKEVVLSKKEHQEALSLLRDPNLLNRILKDFEACGIVGEGVNKLTGYLAALSRKLEEPLAIIIQSASSAGKSSLMDSILSLIPEEDRVKYSAMTGQSLFYMTETSLKHKILAIAEEEGAERASYALKLLQSEGELTIASTGQDPKTGRLVTNEYKIEGPVMLFMTTTSIEIDEELLNRCIVLTVDDGREQTKAIHSLQRESQTLSGLLNRLDRKEILKVHRNAQRLLRPLLVANPFAKKLTFLNDKTRTRRDHLKYLTLIRSIALLHQYQRPIKKISHRGKLVEYIEVTLKDIEIANKLAHEVLGRTLDELPPQTRKLLTLIERFVRANCKK